MDNDEMLQVECDLGEIQQRISEQDEESELGKPKSKRRMMIAGLLSFVVSCTGILAIGAAVGYRNTSSDEAAAGAIVREDVQKEKTSMEEESGAKKLEKVGFLTSWMSAKGVTVHSAGLDQIIYFGFGINETGNIIRVDEEGREVLEWHYFKGEHFSKVRDEALRNNVKVLVAIKSFDNETIDKVVSSKQATETAAREISGIIREYKLSGVNIDFEYVTDTDYPTTKHLVNFLGIIDGVLSETDPNLILSIDVNPMATLTDRAYDMVKIGEICDQVIVMTYDFTRASSTAAGPVAPLRAGENEHSIDNTIKALRGRVPGEKLLLGIPFYGYEWQTVGYGYKSATVPNSGALATIARVSELIAARDDINISRDALSGSPWLSYVQNGAIKQIYYEDEGSIELKLKYAKDNKLGGIAIWSLGYEGKESGVWDLIQRY